MDIHVPKSLNFMALGGRLASSWDDCGKQSEQLYESEVVPYATSVIAPLFNVVKHVDRLPSMAKREPVTYVVQGDDSWKVTKSELTEKSKRQSKRKDFEKAKRTDKIVLNPMLNCKVFGSATPKILHADSVIDSYAQAQYEVYLNASRPGVCRYQYYSIPDIRVDSFARAVRVDGKLYRGVTVTPVAKSEIDRVMRLVKLELDSIQPDVSLVTQVVSEANSASWDIATEIAEAPETVKYILNGLKEGIKLLLRAKREIKQNLSSGSVRTDIASIWMQYRYALMPIVYSVNDALDVLGMDAVKFQSFRGRTDAPLFDGETELGGYTIKSAPDYNNRVYLRYKYDVDSKIHQGLQINLAATAWELLPLSFVFDWFFQVGDYLTAAFQPGVVDDYGCQQSVRCKGSLILEGDSSEVLKLDIDYYRCRIIKPDAFIGVNSDVFISFKRSMDALALSWLLFGKKTRRG